MFRRMTSLRSGRHSRSSTIDKDGHVVPLGKVGSLETLDEHEPSTEPSTGGYESPLGTQAVGGASLAPLQLSASVRESFDETSSRFVVAMLVGREDDDDVMSQSSVALTSADAAERTSVLGDAAGAKDGRTPTAAGADIGKPANHSLRVALRSLQMTLVRSNGSELVHAKTTDLLVRATLDSKHIRVHGTIGSLEVLHLPLQVDDHLLLAWHRGRRAAADFRRALPCSSYLELVHWTEARGG